MNARFFRPLSVSVLMVLLGSSARAAGVSAADAARAASAWVDRGYAMGRIAAGRAVAGVDEVEDPATGAQLHVVRFEGGGYVVLSADDLVDPVIAFSETGDGLDLDERNPFWSLLRGDIAAREAAAGVERGGAGRKTARRAASAKETAGRKKWAALLADGDAKPQGRGAVAAPSDLRVGSFVDSRWNQGTHDNSPSGQTCYNYYTPNNYVCGCVATAGAQIMRHWRWPQTSVTPLTQTCQVDGSLVSETMYGGVYDWASMPLVPADGVTEAQRQAIGKLTYDIGVSVGMKWSEGGSGSNVFGLVLRFRDTFGYANAVAASFDDGHPFSLAELEAIVIPNCDRRAPVGLGISDAGNHGHAVLADGYGWTDGAFCIHVNCGWGGDGDAWYVPPDIEDYTILDQVVFNVFPEQTGSILSGRVLDASGAPVEGASVVLKRGSSTVETATSDANGIYAFVATAGSYLVTASRDGVSATIGADLGATTGVSLVPGGTGSWDVGSYATIGNTYGNDIALTGVAAVPAPVFDPEGCLFYPSTNVTITCSDPSATIRYTTDGSAPTESSTRYAGPIFVDDDVTIRARAFSSGKNPSRYCRNLRLRCGPRRAEGRLLRQSDQDLRGERITRHRRQFGLYDGSRRTVAHPFRGPLLLADPDHLVSVDGTGDGTACLTDLLPVFDHAVSDLCRRLFRRYTPVHHSAGVRNSARFLDLCDIPWIVCFSRDNLPHRRHGWK